MPPTHNRLCKHCGFAMVAIESRSMNMKSFAEVIAPLAILLLVAACGNDTPEQRLEAAGEKVEAVSDDLESIRQRIEEHEAELDRLRAQRDKAKDRLGTLEERLAARATDTALFRAVQTALLEAPDLKESAINVLVEDGNVTLVGSVPSAADRDQALAIAGNVAGVDSVRSRIRIDDPAAG